MVDSNERERLRALARNLCARITRLGDEGRDELAVIDGFVQRLELGFNHYGPLDLRRDRRDFVRERDEELVDAEVYRSCQRTSERYAQLDRIEIGLDEIADAPLEIQAAARRMAWDQSDLEDAG